MDRGIQINDTEDLNVMFHSPQVSTIGLKQQNHLLYRVFTYNLMRWLCFCHNPFQNIRYLP